MIGVKSYAEKAIDAVARNRAALERSERRLAEFLAIPDAGEDGDAIYNRRRELRDLEDRVEADREALARSEALAEQARASEAEAEQDRRHAAAQKLARAGEKLTHEVAAAAERLATLLASLEANRAEVEAANAARGKREFIQDGEARVRGGIGKGRPAITEKNLVWVDAKDNVVKGEIYDPAIPKWVRNPAAVKQVEKVFVISEASPGFFEMPERLAAATKLVGLHGQTIWPRRN